MPVPRLRAIRSPGDARSLLHGMIRNRAMLAGDPTGQAMPNVCLDSSHLNGFEIFLFTEAFHGNLLSRGVEHQTNLTPSVTTNRDRGPHDQDRHRPDLDADPAHIQGHGPPGGRSPPRP